MKNYLKGFLKGVVIALIFAFLLTLPFFYYPQIDKSEGYWLIVWIIATSIPIYFIKKRKLPNAWIIPSLFLSLFMLPFILGSGNFKPVEKNGMD